LTLDNFFNGVFLRDPLYANHTNIKNFSRYQPIILPLLQD
jgi:hypothetical protein